MEVLKFRGAKILQTCLQQALINKTINFPSRTRLCLVCKTDNCTVEHFIGCAGARSLNSLCWRRKWAQALPVIQRLLNRVEGLELADLRLEPPAGVGLDEEDVVLKVYD